MYLPFILTLPGSPFSPFSPCCPAEPGVPLLTKKRVVNYLQQGIKVGIEGKIRYLSLAWFPQKRPIKVTKRMHWSLLMAKKRSVNGTWSFQADSATCTNTQLCWFCINWCLVRKPPTEIIFLEELLRAFSMPNNTNHCLILNIDTLLNH